MFQGSTCIFHSWLPRQTVTQSFHTLSSFLNLQIPRNPSPKLTLTQTPTAPSDKTQKHRKPYMVVKHVKMSDCFSQWLDSLWILLCFRSNFFVSFVKKESEMLLILPPWQLIKKSCLYYRVSLRVSLCCGPVSVLMWLLLETGCQEGRQ